MAQEPTTEPRALSAALAGPAMTTRAGGVAMHAADRHVERWAPETTASKSRPLRNLGFVDRTIAPWIQTAQRSASLRLFSQYRAEGMSERPAGDVSWVFPRPWYQDELDWMAAARQAPASAPMLTTRGTYVAPESKPAALPAALYEYIAPSLSIASPTTQAQGIGYGGSDAPAAYSPLVPLAAVQAAEVMQRAVAPVASQARATPALRNVLQQMLERSAAPREEMASRVSMQAPELVTPPAPRAPNVSTPVAPQNDASEAMQLAQRYAEQRAQVAEVQRIARQAAEREMATRIEAARAQLAAQTTASATAATPAVRDATARAEAELRARTEAARTSDPQRLEETQRLDAARAEAARTDGGERAREAARSGGEARAEAATKAAELARQQDAERARIEERIAQRLAERTSAQRLHEQSRAEAAVHARQAAIEATRAQAEAGAAPAPTATDRAPAEVAAAIAALPPDLAAFIGHRPDRALHAIDELNDALRTVELLSRAAASGETFAPTRGPRLVMPAGLGGLVAALDRAHAISEQPAVAAGTRAPGLAPLRLAEPGAQTATSALRVPTMSWLSAPTARAIGTAAPTALEATAASTPAALSHVAWADRWLARFAGASQQSLDTLSAAAGHDLPSRMQALVAAAPGSVFVAPVFDVARSGDVVRFEASGHPVVSPARAAMPASPLASSIAPAASVAPATTAPAASVAPATTATTTAPAELALPDEARPVVRFADDAETPDDVFAAISAATTRGRAAAPTTPGASPAVHGAALTAPPIAAPSPMVTIDRHTAADTIAHAAPAAPGAGFAAQLASSPFAPALRHVLPLPTAPSFDIRALFGGGLSATYLAGLLATSSTEVETLSRMLPSWAAWSEQPPDAAAVGERAIPSWDATYVAPDALDASRADVDAPASRAQLEATRTELAAAVAPMTTLRSALLSWNVEQTAGGPVFTPASEPLTPTVISRSTPSPISTATARTMLDTMSLPMLGDGQPEHAPDDAAWTAPGMLADRAHAWSVAQERSSADLSFDFVPPELVLAARVYGLGPAEAAQAARLALAGPGHLTAMAGTVDRTFVQAMAIEAERRERAQTREQLATAYPTRGGEVIAATSPRAIADDGIADTRSSEGAAFGPTGIAFGIDRKPPRGAFLWPSATVAALGLHAAAPDGQQSMSVAALELLAAQAVAELGTFTALGDATLGDDARSIEGGADARVDVRGDARPTGPAFARSLGAVGTDEPSEADVLGSASALVPSSRRARFDALYVALSQSSASAGWSPAARAARALALAGRGEDGPVSARERAAFAWDVLPVVYADAIASQPGGGAFGGEASMPVVASDGTPTREREAREAARRAGRTYVGADSVSVESRPGLGALSARAGEALGSYVVPPSATESSSSSSSSQVGAVLRAPSAAQELVRTGRPAGRHGGGETEIPAWFEAAARKMLEERSPSSDGISLAELTLVTAAPASHVAASTRSAPSAAPVVSGTNSQAQPAEAGASNIDVEKIANDIYRHILVLMDVARARNGEPYL